MSHTKHTPGPWTVRQIGDTSVQIRNWKALNPCSIDAHYDQIEADKRLIAAAPEMLEALERVFMRYTFEQVTDWREERRTCAEIIGKAIAKARGES